MYIIMLKCQLCEKRFTTQKNLSYHVGHQVCQKFNNRKCPRCGKLFKTKQMCTYHVTHEVCTMIPDDSASAASSSTDSKPKIVLKSRYEHMSRDELITKLTQFESKYETLRDNPTCVNQNNNIIVFPSAWLERKVSK